MFQPTPEATARAGAGGPGRRLHRGQVRVGALRRGSRAGLRVPRGHPPRDRRGHGARCSTWATPGTPGRPSSGRGCSSRSTSSGSRSRCTPTTSTATRWSPRECEIPIAAGEEECTVAGFDRLVELGGVDVVQVDPSRVGPHPGDDRRAPRPDPRDPHREPQLHHRHQRGGVAAPPGERAERLRHGVLRGAERPLPLPRPQPHRRSSTATPASPRSPASASSRTPR